MKIAFIINDIKTEKAMYTTVNLALSAYKMKHTVYLISVGDLGYSHEGNLTALARTVNDHTYKSSDTFLKAIQISEPMKISSEELDVIFLRNDPSQDHGERNWAQNAPYIFCQIAVRQGVIVVNNPEKLSDAINKMYFQHFPEILRPKTIITRDPQEIKDFFLSQKEKIILKPLQGSGGKNVFLVDKKNKMNLKQIIDAISRDGYIIAQEYLPEATEGDTRLFLMNGNPLECDGKYAAIRRVNGDGDIRSNLSAGGSTKSAQMTEDIFELSEILRPKLVQDGMFLVGVDIVGNKLMEVNVFSPGTLNLMSDMYEVDFCGKVIHALEKKVHYRETYGKDISNKIIGTL